MVNLDLITLGVSVLVFTAALVLWLTGRMATTSFRGSLIGGLVGALFVGGLLSTVGILEWEEVRIDGNFYMYKVGDLKYINENPPLYDGPHVFWQSDTLAQVASVCGQEPKVRAVTAADTLRFQDPCAPGDTFALSTAPPEPDSAVFQDAPRVFAVSDGEGRYDRLLRLLTAAGVTDSTGRWTWGEGHLVLLGDFVDRGTKVTETLWLIHRLERASRQHGGRVHYVLGNHEAMLLRGDTRYADVKYDLLAERLNTSIPGLYGPKTEIGRWLRTKPTIVRIDSLLFVHGGISPLLAGRDFSLAQINEGVRTGLRAPLSPHVNATLDTLFGSRGPLWYRGYFETDSLQARSIRQDLAQFGAETAVVGHTTVEKIQRRHHGRVIAIDVGFRKPGQGEGLLIEDGQYYRVGTDGKRRAL